MKVQVKDLNPNPFRNMAKYEIKRDKVEALKTSIEETTFWDNVLARPNGNGFQLAYGHHRWIALKELAIEVVDIPVRELDDSTMLRIMANENLSDWAATPGVINETVFAAKDFLDKELGKVDDLKSAGEIASRLGIKDQAALGAAKKGVGRELIKRFLGANWSDAMIREALAVYRSVKQDEEREAQREKERLLQIELLRVQKEEEARIAEEKEEEKIRVMLERQKARELEIERSKAEAARIAKEEEESPAIDREAYESFDSQNKASEFRKAVKENKIPKSIQKGLAKEINSKGISGPAISDRVRQTAEIMKPKKKEFKPQERTHLDKFAEEISADASELSGKLRRIINNVDQIYSTHSQTVFYSYLKTLHKLIGEILEKGENKNDEPVPVLRIDS